MWLVAAGYVRFVSDALLPSIGGAAGDRSDLPVDLQPTRGTPPYRDLLLRRCSLVTNTTHPSIQPHLKRFTDAVAPCFRIIMSAHRNVTLFPSCLRAIQRALYGTRHTIKLDVHVFYEADADRKIAFDVLHDGSFEWIHGRVTLVQHDVDPADITRFPNATADLWKPSSATEFGIFIDDGVEVSN
jgi:hypothetical protein